MKGAPILASIARRSGGRSLPRVFSGAPMFIQASRASHDACWIGGKKSSLSCLFARTDAGGTEHEALSEIRKNAKLVHQLRRAHVGLKLAATTLVSGIASACS